VIDALGRPQSVLVLGGTSDIADAVVRALVDRGRLRRAVLAGRDEQALACAAERLRSSIGITSDVAVARLDAADPTTLVPVVDRAFDAGDVDVVLLAVGALGDQDLLEREPSSTYALAVSNYAAPVTLGLAAARRLREQGHGVLVVLSSVAGMRPRRSNYVYGSSKAGLDAFSRGLTEALRGSGARVLVVRPGFVHTRMTRGREPAPFATTTEAVAAVVLDGMDNHRTVVYAPPVLRGVMAVLTRLPQPIFRHLPG